MNKTFLAFGMLLISFACSSNAILVTLPNALGLTQRLRTINRIGIDSLIRETTIISELAEQHKEVLDVALSVKRALNDLNAYYFQQPRSFVMKVILKTLRTEILRTIFKDLPDAIAELKQYNLI